MNKYYLVFTSILICFIMGGSVFSKGNKVGNAAVTYLSSENIYIDAGSNSGISVGDSLTVVRRGVTIAVLIVKNVAGNSCACIKISGKGKIKVGDKVPLDSIIGRNNKSASSTSIRKTKTKSSKSQLDMKNRLKGNISFQSYWLKDMTGSKLSSFQPSLRTRIRIENLAGTGLTLQLKHRSRVYHRSRSLQEGTDRNEWVHKIYEFAVYSDREKSLIEWAAGRILSPYVRGMGYLDGGYIAKKIHPSYRVGVVIGTEPDAQNTGIKFNRRKFGAFITLEKGSYATRHLMLTAALSTSYEKGNINREFFYFQGNYSHDSWISLYQSVELDINRSWRKNADGNRFSITNYYSTLNLRIMQKASLYFSYDARKNIRYFETKNYPDSLFDDGVHRGLKVGFSFRPKKRIRINANTGIRFRQDGLSNNQFTSFGIAVSRFPLRRHSVSFRMSWIKTMFTTGYQPYLTYRFPLRARLMLTATGSGYIYKTGSNTTHNFYIDLSTYYSFTSDYYISTSLRQYFDSQLQSVQIFIEFGVKL
ncbi:MAG: hypothetical protein ACE5D6_09050 [Candidatus Zixiibacteriota bacterium]